MKIRFRRPYGCFYVLAAFCISSSTMAYAQPSSGADLILLSPFPGTVAVSKKPKISFKSSQPLLADGQQGVLFTAPVGNDTYAGNMAFPAIHPDVIAVAGFDQNNNPLPNKVLAMKADATAPARDIFSSIPGNKHNFLDGTSFSTAAISGILALSLETQNDMVAKILPHFSNNGL